MQQIEVGEPIQVLVDFQPGDPRIARRVKAVPRAFLWKSRRYLIQSLNLIYKEKQGEATIYYFSVSTETNMYKISFNNLTLEWHLVEMWSE